MHRFPKYTRQLLLILLFVPLVFILAQEKGEQQPRPLELWDMLKWNSINGAAFSRDGSWLAYLLAPAEGNSTLTVRSTKDTTEYTFPVGEMSYGRLAFSRDSRWLAFAIAPTREETEKLKKQKKPRQNKMGLLDLATGRDTTFEKVAQFSFPEENPRWLAMKKYAPEEKGKDSGKGTGLILHDLNSGSQLHLGDVAEYGFNKKGDWLAFTVDADDQSGNGVQLMNLNNGVVSVLDNDKAEYKGLTWNEKGDGLAVLKGKKDEDYTEPLYSLLGFYRFSSQGPQKILYDPAADESFPDSMTISPNQDPRWRDDFSALFFGIHEVKLTDKAKEERGKKSDEKEETNGKKASPGGEDEDELPDMVIWHWKDKRLQSQQWVQESRDKNYSYLCEYRVKDNKFIRLADDELKDIMPALKGNYLLGYDDSPYALMGGLDGRYYRDVYVIDLQTGERRLALEKSRWNYPPSPDGSHFLYYQDGQFRSYEMASGKSYSITENMPVSFVDTEDDHNVKDPPTRFLGWLKDGRGVLLSDNWDIWRVDVHGRDFANLTLDGRRDSIRYVSRFRLDPEEKGADFSQPQYFRCYQEWSKEGGVVRINKGKPGSRRLLWGKAAFSRLVKARDVDLYLYTRETPSDYPDYYCAGPDLQNGRRLTDANPQQKDFLWCSGVKLITYRNDDGQKLEAALYLPAGYEEGRSYPTIVYMYEKLTQRAYTYPMPRVYGFNQAYYNSQGYAVLTPDIVFRVNDPGISSVGCIVPAVKAAVKTGIVDEERLGIHGHSWGGYQTAFAITQTPIFKAAVAGAPLTNMISMYSSIYWNSGGGNMAIFESSQGRFYGSYLDNLDAYARNSPVYHAKNVVTPLLLLHNDKDGAVDWNQGIEYYSILRRLQKPVVMLEYKGENHGLAKMENRKDYTVRMKEFFDHYLKDAPAPSWWEKGVNHLQLKEHLKERAKLLKPPEKEKDEKKEELKKVKEIEE